MENQIMFLKEGKSKNVAEGWKKNLPEGLKLKNASRRMKNNKIFQEVGQLKKCS